MATSVPVISTGQGGLGEAMGPWAREPFVFDIADTKSLERAIVAAVDLDSRQLGEMRDYARSHAWPAVAESIKALTRVVA